MLQILRVTSDTVPNDTHLDPKLGPIVLSLDPVFFVRSQEDLPASHQKPAFSSFPANPAVSLPSPRLIVPEHHNLWVI